MSTASTVRAWSTTPASNASADSDIASSDSQSPDTLDNNIRSIMAACAKQEADTGGALAAGGSANALTVTTNQVLSSGHVTDGLRLLVKATADNSSTTVTFAPDGLTAHNIKRADGSALAVGSIKNGMYLDLVYNSGSTEWRAANIAPININVGASGMILLASGTASGATLDLVLTSYTSYRGLKFVISGLIPATDGVDLWVRFSTDGGGTYDSSGYNWVTSYAYGAAAPAGDGNQSDAKIVIRGDSGTHIGSASTEGIDLEINLFGQTSTARWCRMFYTGYFIDSSASVLGNFISGGGSREAAQDTDAIRFLFSSGNITSGSYAVYGLV